MKKKTIHYLHVLQLNELTLWMYCECCACPPSTNFSVVPVALNANPLIPYSTIDPSSPTSFIVDHVTTISFTFSTEIKIESTTNIGGIRANSIIFKKFICTIVCCNTSKSDVDLLWLIVKHVFYLLTVQCTCNA